MLKRKRGPADELGTENFPPGLGGESTKLFIQAREGLDRYIRDETNETKLTAEEYAQVPTKGQSLLNLRKAQKRKK